jgi:hypothetical protein
MQSSEELSRQWLQYFVEPLLNHTFINITIQNTISKQNLLMRLSKSPESSNITWNNTSQIN